MKKLILFLTLILFLGCSKDDVVEERKLLFEISLDGDSFDPYERYSYGSNESPSNAISNTSCPSLTTTSSLVQPKKRISVKSNSNFFIFN